MDPTQVSASNSADSVSPSISSSSNAPSQPLILKCACDERLKRIRYSDANSLTFAEFHARIARAFQFDTTEFEISWIDDDGEYCDISSDEDLSEAISFFSPNDQTSSSSGSGDSYGSAVSMRVILKVDSAISLSDFGSDLGSELGRDARSLQSRSECSSRREGRSSQKGSAPRVASSALSRSDSRSNTFGPGIQANLNSSSVSSASELILNPGLDLDLDLDVNLDTREGRSRLREDQSYSASSRRRTESSSDSEDLDLRAPSSSSSNRSRRKGTKSGRSERSSLPPINPFVPPPLAYTQQIATVLWNKFGRGLDPDNQTLPASWAEVAQDLAEASVAPAQRRLDVGATRLISQAEALGKLTLRRAESWKNWATGSSVGGGRRGGNGNGNGKISVEEQPQKEEDLASYSRQVADDTEGLSQLGLRSDFGLPSESSYILGETGYVGDSLDESSDSGESMATVSRESLGPATRRGIERSESQTTLRAADHRALQALQQEPWTATSAGTRPERECECTCSKCKQKFDPDSLRYVCDICGPARITCPTSQATLNGSCSSSSPARSVLSDSTERTSTATSDAARPSTAPELNANISNSHENAGDDMALELSEEWSDESSEISDESSDLLDSDSGASSLDQSKSGFELCFSCFASHSRTHVDLHTSSRTGTSISIGAPLTPVSRGSRSRNHAFFELVRKDGKWTTVEDEGPRACKHCGIAGWIFGRYKCSQCDDLSLCQKCFLKVADIHPIHVFLRMPALVPVTQATQVQRRVSSSEVVHESVRCASCSTPSIRGTRFHCATCLGGADFCSNCEESGRNIENSAVGHNSSHILIKIKLPLNASVLGNSLIRAQQRLGAETERRQLRSRGMQVSASEPMMRTSRDQDHRETSLLTPPYEDPPAWDEVTSARVLPPGDARRTVSRDTVQSDDWYSLSRSHPVPCSACGAEISTSRFLCANCPIKETAGGQGFNLCELCEVNSLDLHDPSHFFVKIRASAPNSNHSRRASALALNPFTENLGNLLPPLYRDIVSRPGIADLASNPSSEIITGPRDLVNRSFAGAVRRFVSRHNASGFNDLIPVNELVHASILCDKCYEVIQGPWLRCCNCVTSFDICSQCEPNVEHDRSHVFAVFKQGVDMPLFKSLVDHGDGDEAGARRGASRSMLPYLIV